MSDPIQSPQRERLRTAEFNGADIVAAAGGWRGIVESILPGLLFLAVYTTTKDLWPAVIAAAAVSVVGFVVRLVRRESVWPAVGGMLALALSAFLAARSGNDADFFLPGFWTNGAYGLGLIVSVLVGWPVIGVAAGFLVGTGTAWREERSLRRFFGLLTLGWAAFFLLRLVVQLPLYLVGNVEALAVTRLIMGAPMYAVLLVLTVVLARGAMKRAGLTARSGTDANPEPTVDEPIAGQSSR